MNENIGLITQMERPSGKAFAIFKLLSFGINLGLAIAEIVIGSKYLYECPAQPNIPIYLIVLGSFVLFLVISQGFLQIRKSEYEHTDPDAGQNWGFLRKFNALINLFLVAWFITGCVWVYQIYQPYFDPSSSPYCNRTVYLFAFWFNNITLIISFIVIIIGFFKRCSQNNRPTDTGV